LTHQDDRVTGHRGSAHDELVYLRWWHCSPTVVVVLPVYFQSDYTDS